MNALSILSTKTMTYDAQASLQGFAIIEKLAGFAGTLISVARQFATRVPALRAAQA
jgi:hypothetical protein